MSAQCDAGDVVLRVRDNGPGIAPELLPRVFDLFAQSERDLDRPQGGLGIGLTVVRRLVELHGGRVEAHSGGADQGAELIVRLPAVVAAGSETDATAPLPIGAGSADVLVVEDNVDAGESLMMLLELFGHRVRVAHDGPSAIDAACARPPDVMLVDIGLPGMDGYEVARQIRARPALRGDRPRRAHRLRPRRGQAVRDGGRVRPPSRQTRRDRRTAATAGEARPAGIHAR